jgi:regulator of CtrA degradation
LEKEKVKFSATPSDRGGPGYDELPQTLRDFIDKGDRLFDRVMQLDALEKGDLPERTPGRINGVADQLSRLKAAFGRAD